MKSINLLISIATHSKLMLTAIPQWLVQSIILYCCKQMRGQFSVKAYWLRLQLRISHRFCSYTARSKPRGTYFHDLYMHVSVHSCVVSKQHAMLQLQTSKSQEGKNRDALYAHVHQHRIQVLPQQSSFCILSTTPESKTHLTCKKTVQASLPISFLLLPP